MLPCSVREIRTEGKPYGQYIAMNADFNAASDPATDMYVVVAWNADGASVMRVSTRTARELQLSGMRFEPQRLTPDC